MADDSGYAGSTGTPPSHVAEVRLVGVIESHCFVGLCEATGQSISRRFVRVDGTGIYPVICRGETAIRHSEQIRVGDTVEVKGRLAVTATKSVIQVVVEDADMEVLCQAKNPRL